MNARNRSMKSWFMGRLAAEERQFQAESPRLQDALGVWNLEPELEIVPIGLG
jgi:hypothetical protein